MKAEGQPCHENDDAGEEAEGVPEAAHIMDDNNMYEVAEAPETENDPANDDHEIGDHLDVGHLPNALLPPDEVEDRAAALDAALANIHPAFAPAAPPAPILLRHASTSSLDECSQRTSCATATKILGLNAGASERGWRPSHKNPTHASRVLEALRELRKKNELCDVTLVAGGREVCI